MRLYYDLHIHSALSPCADDDMTPNNIVNMAKLKGLDLITVSDHNCGRNVEAASKVAEQAGILFLPGIEMTTAEEVHVLAFFAEDVDHARNAGMNEHIAKPVDLGCLSEIMAKYLL